MFWSRRSEHAREEDLSAYLDGELSGRRESSIAVHIEACERCRALLEELAAAKSALALLPRAPSPRSFRLGPEFGRAQPPLPREGPRRALPAFAPAVALTLFVALVAVDLATLPEGEQAVGGFAGRATEKLAGEAVPSFQAAPGRSAADEAGVPAASITPPRTGAPEPAATALAPAPSEQETHLLGSDDSSSDRLWLRLLEVAAAAGFLASLVVLAWPRIRGGTR